jgi:organic hydroperoxide reductase OsmC/OhrA
VAGGREEKTGLFSTKIKTNPMKLLNSVIAACLLTAVTGMAGELNEADKKWSEAIEKMMAKGATTITTPDEKRVKLAKELAAKLGREAKVEKTEKSYKVVISATKSDDAAIAQVGNQ